MKHLIAVIFLITTITTASAYNNTFVQTSFFGCKFGDSYDVAYSKLENTGYELVEIRNALYCNPEPNFISFGGLNFDLMSLSFEKNKLDMICFSKLSDSDDEILLFFENAKSVLKKRYPEASIDDDTSFGYKDDIGRIVNISVELNKGVNLGKKHNVLLIYLDVKRDIKPTKPAIENQL